MLASVRGCGRRPHVQLTGLCPGPVRSASGVSSSAALPSWPYFQQEPPGDLDVVFNCDLDGLAPLARDANQDIPDRVDIGALSQDLLSVLRQLYIVEHETSDAWHGDYQALSSWSKVISPQHDLILLSRVHAVLAPSAAAAAAAGDSALAAMCGQQLTTIDLAYEQYLPLQSRVGIRYVDEAIIENDFVVRGRINFSPDDPASEMWIKMDRLRRILGLPAWDYHRDGPEDPLFDMLMRLTLVDPNVYQLVRRLPWQDAPCS